MMENRYDVVVFDLDGTLLDTTEGVLGAVRYTIGVLGCPMPDETRMTSFIGPPIRDSFTQICGLSDPVLQEAVTIFRERYKDADLMKARPYEGIYALCGGLAARGIRIAVATYKREDCAVALLKHYGFDRYTKIMHGSDYENKRKKQDIIRMCIAEAGVSDSGRVVMVGDTVHDAEGAKQLGVDFIGVTYGFGFRGENDLRDVPHVGAADRPTDILKMMMPGSKV